MIYTRNKTLQYITLKNRDYFPFIEEGQVVCKHKKTAEVLDFIGKGLVSVVRTIRRNSKPTVEDTGLFSSEILLTDLQLFGVRRGFVEV